jgi:hypothetical protein
MSPAKAILYLIAGVAICGLIASVPSYNGVCFEHGRLLSNDEIIRQVAQKIIQKPMYSTWVSRDHVIVRENYRLLNVESNDLEQIS